MNKLELGLCMEMSFVDFTSDLFLFFLFFFFKEGSQPFFFAFESIQASPM